MSFSQSIGNIQALRQSAASMLKIVDELESAKKAVVDKFSGTNYVPMPGLKILKKHLTSIQDGKSDEPINVSEFIILQNELQNLGGFINGTQSFGVLTGDHSQQSLADAYRAIAVKYATMIDGLIDSPSLFSSHQSSQSRSLV